MIFVNIGVLVLSVYFEVENIRTTRADTTEGKKVKKRESFSDRKSDIVQEHHKDTLNPMLSLHENCIELVEIKSRTNVLDFKKCDEDEDKDKDKKHRELNFEFERLNNTNQVSGSQNFSSKSANIIDSHEDVEKGSGVKQNTILRDGKMHFIQDHFDGKRASVGQNTVKRILGKARDQPAETADSDDEF